MTKHRATSFGSGQFHGDARDGAAHAPASAPVGSGKSSGKSSGKGTTSRRGDVRPLAGTADSSARHASAPAAGGTGGVFVGLATAAVSAVAPAAGRALGNVLLKSGGKLAAASILGLAQVGLAVAAIIDIARRDESQLNGPKALWYGAQTINWVGPIAYFLGGRKLER